MGEGQWLVHNCATWKGSGPVAGVLGVNPDSKSVKALQAYSPSTLIEFVFDPKTNTFVVGKPKADLGGSPHQQLAKSIDASNDVVGGMFSGNGKGEIFTDEFSGHFGTKWTPEIRQQFERAMKEYGLPVTHTPWR